MEIVKFKPKTEEESKKNLEYMLSIIDDFRSMVEKGEVEEFVISYMDSSSSVELSANCKDIVGAIGILEMSKQIVLHQVMD